MAISTGPFDVIRSPQCMIFWEGFEGYTDGMQARGWDFAVQDRWQRDDGRSIRLVFRHKRFGWTGMAECSQPSMLMEAMQPWEYRRPHLSSERDRWPVFSAVVMRENDALVLAPQTRSYAPASFVRVDMQPTFEQVKQVTMRSLDIFREWKDPEEIIVEPATVATLLEQIKKMQAPELAQIRERNRLREARERRPEVRHATILSIAA